MTGIVVVIIDGRHGTQLVEALDEHTLRVKVGETERSHHLGHPFLLTPSGNSIQQGT